MTIYQLAVLQVTTVILSVAHYKTFRIRAPNALKVKSSPGFCILKLKVQTETFKTSAKNVMFHVSSTFQYNTHTHTHTQPFKNSLYILCIKRMHKHTRTHAHFAGKHLITNMQIICECNDVVPLKSGDG